MRFRQKLRFMATVAIASIAGSDALKIDSKILEQLDATADSKILKSIKLEASENGSLNKLAEIRDDVMTSGYWFVLCLDIAKAWDTCRNPEDFLSLHLMENKNVVDDATGETSEPEDSGEQKEVLDVNEAYGRENQCRNEMMHYLSRTKDSQSVYNALQMLDDFRSSLH